jgi:hypothetical protein
MEHHGQPQAPRPGTWLQVSRLDEVIQHDVALGDKLYFRAISPLGLFECYAPKLQTRFWIEPKNVQVVTDLAITHALDQGLPASQRVH